MESKWIKEKENLEQKILVDNLSLNRQEENMVVLALILKKLLQGQVQNYL